MECNEPAGEGQGHSPWVPGYEDLDAEARRELRITMAFLPFLADVGLLSGMPLNDCHLADRHMHTPEATALN
jgi:hypothetical protein